MSKFKDMSNEELKRVYVPDVYQHSIYSIDYQKLKDAGIRLISFDIDDTIAAWEAIGPEDAVKVKFADLRNMGFHVALLTNGTQARGKRFSRALGLEENDYIAEAEKPLSKNFQKLQERFGLEKSQIAHVGNSQMDDVAGGNVFGVTTCLVRRVGKVTKLIGIGGPVGILTEGQKLRWELKERGIWRKHHKEVKGDQYYQLGELPAYQKSRFAGRR